MNRNAPLMIGLLAATLIAACGKKEEQAPAAAPAVPQAETTAPAPAPQAVGDACTQNCGTTVVTIQCAAGETPVCDCGPPPAASCKVPAGSP